MAKIALPPVSPVAVAKQPRVLVPACFASMHGESRDMIAATIDTLVVTNELAMAEVMKHPHVLHKIKQELDTIVGPNGMVEDLTKVGENLRAKLGLHERRIKEDEEQKKMEIKEAQEVAHEVVNELDNIPNFNGAFRHRAIDWLTENPIKFVIIKALPLDEKKITSRGSRLSSLGLPFNNPHTQNVTFHLPRNPRFGPQITIFDSVATLHVAISGPTTTHHVTIFDLIV
ncbi:hypothetical protein JHK82_016189 [Glycine max]|nr:hypothetical protein JHK82_016189 [Glycine max]